jgi:hypothetical protein
MANITRTVLFPVPTEFMGDTQDDTVTGIATYNGPRDIKVWFLRDAAGNPTNIVQAVHDADEIGDRPVPENCVSVDLNAETDTLTSMAVWGGIAGPTILEVAAGPTDEPNPTINDPCHFQEAYDMRSFEYNHDTGVWIAPRYSSISTEDEEGHQSFSWEWVRETRDRLLLESDTKIAVDSPESHSAPWREYRQKLRDLPEAWAGVGTATHLIVWPRDPDQQAYDLTEVERRNREIAEGSD